MTKKHYDQFAEIIKYTYTDIESSSYGDIELARKMANMVIKVSIKDNPRFDKKRFLADCGLKF